MAKAENKTRAGEHRVEDFLATVADPTRRADAEVLIELMHKATGKPPVMWGPSIIGFDSYHYVYESGREGDSCLIGFSPRKTELVLYNLGAANDAEARIAALGKTRSGKGCLYVKRLSDVNLKALEKLIKDAAVAMRKRYPA